MNKSTVADIINTAIDDYQRAPYYINTGKPKFLRVQSETDIWFIDPVTIQLDEQSITVKLYKTRDFEVANITNFTFTLAYTSILSILKITYDDNNDFGEYNATVIRVSNDTLPILMPY